ncbi:MAG: transcriptional regulator MntR [Acetobacteraceae bacterium]
MTEAYIGLIADLLDSCGEARTVEIARRRGVTHPTAIKAIRRLKREGLVVGRRYRSLFLTDQGKAMAEKIRTRRNTVLALLLALGVPAEAAAVDAAGIERYLSCATLTAFQFFLAGPLALPGDPSGTRRQAMTPYVQTSNGGI